MATVITPVEVTPNGILQVKMSDGLRYCLVPGSSLEGKEQEVIDAANTAWTQPVIDAYNAAANPIPTLAEAKAIRLDVMKNAYKAAIAAGFTTNSILMQADIPHIDSLKSLYALAAFNQEATMDLIDQNNVTHTGVLTSDVLTMGMELGEHARTLLFQHQARRTSINDAADVAAVNAITWS